jgi:hypothetical protein
MRLDTEQPIVEAAPAEACAKPPPRVSDLRLFQTMDELRSRHGEATGMKQRIMYAAGALLAGTLLFAALYGLILFPE